MKPLIRYSGLLLLCALMFSKGWPQKPTAKSQSIQFNYPEEIADTAKKTFEKKIKQGHAIYITTCGSCHNKSVNGKTVIPDFSLPQLLDYEMRMSPEHGDQLTDRFISDEEMERVILFLRYKKNSGVPVRPGPVLKTNKTP